MFIQLHLLTSYPPANLNRDDAGRPKTAVMGGVTRLRVSSQSLKRAWRTSDIFARGLDEARGQRTRRIGNLAEELLRGRVDEKLAAKSARAIAEVFGKVEDKAAPRTEQLAFIGPVERQAVEDLVETVAASGKPPTEDRLQALLSTAPGGADIALFGRMLAANPGFNIEAAAEVAHAVTVHKAQVEDDFFTAVDDLANRAEDDEGAGAGFMGETGFGAGLFYLYLCIDHDLLVRNLGGDKDVARRTLAALTEAAAKVGPTGKRASFGSRAYASYILVERGDQVPRSLSVAFLKPVAGTDFLSAARVALETTVAGMDQVYGSCADARYRLVCPPGDKASGGMEDLIAFIQGGGTGNFTPASA